MPGEARPKPNGALGRTRPLEAATTISKARFGVNLCAGLQDAKTAQTGKVTLCTIKLTSD